ncbi:DUF423 domain-containing protein [Pseudomonas neustonica]|uniref:DUF423 domain-containing protein n=1 Tax=Pseudomonas neustonica TaxID=2487346 RepID=A0ABX9XM18_9PSED|nr:MULTISPECIES: DUF423 domain-containing protein [Pseudomonas]MAB23950.1 hypothetical protein [Pseudomonadales bacterium]MBA6419053.1 DUF423 domain-containing protein [Pseudomonas sp. 5Ae-yellow]ROZ86178.1 DUF423 domain-containing protein [Pseudomonas sp. SSM44]ROZ87903.1 DUF423 domain-containing protein [Pseudomonas neustonica]|tara:strand:- start:4521 stop:4895 length:375 start_codon:yes stop_codon:yes gene_type:complete
MAKWLLLFASFTGFSGVALGAFAAHGLRNKLADNLLNAFQTGVHYQLWHTMALIGVALLLLRFPESGLFKATGVLFALGILLFSGSLYLLALTGISKLGMVTPMGGLTWLIAWGCFAAGIWRSL